MAATVTSCVPFARRHCADSAWRQSRHRVASRRSAGTRPAARPQSSSHGGRSGAATTASCFTRFRGPARRNLCRRSPMSHGSRRGTRWRSRVLIPMTSMPRFGADAAADWVPPAASVLLLTLVVGALVERDIAHSLGALKAAMVRPGRWRCLGRRSRHRPARRGRRHGRHSARVPAVHGPGVAAH